MAEYIQLIIGAILAFLVAATLGPFVIPALIKMKAGQSIREEGPESHQTKSGTPTMGGVIIILAVMIASLVSKHVDATMVLAIGSMIAFGILGFLDDYIKVVLKRNLGLRAYQKLIGQIIIALFIAGYQLYFVEDATSIYIPIVGNYLDLGGLYIPYVIFVVTAIVNSVNLTDGLDGLAAGVTGIVALFFALVAVKLQFLNMSVFGGALTGACIGFLKHNKYPAKVFMGDTGSLALGGGIAAIAVIMNLTLIIPIVGGIFFVEVLSVVLQVASFKLRGKRIFKMSPIHHHFELSGWKETKIVKIFWGITAILCVIGYFMIA